MVPSAICGFCNAEEESDDHIMTRCSKRREITEWLQTEVVKLGCNVPLEEAIRGNVNEGRNRKKIMKLIAVYVSEIWKRRCRKEVPTVTEFSQLWESLGKNQSQQSFFLFVPFILLFLSRCITLFMIYD